MARGRMLNRKIATDEKFNKLCIEGQWLYMRMLPFMDDYGRLTANLFELNYQVIPSAHKNTDYIERLLLLMQENNLISYKKNVVIQFNGFHKNQKIGHRKADSLYPEIIGLTEKDNKSLGKVFKESNNIIKVNKIKNNKNKTNLYKAKPSDLEMVIDYFKEKNIPDALINAKKFYNHYEASGWIRGKTKIKNWRMCLSSWDFTETKNKKEEIIFKMSPSGEHLVYCHNKKCSHYAETSFARNIWDIRKGCSCGYDWKNVRAKKEIKRSTI